MNKKLGKLPARPDAISLKFSAVFDQAKLPTPPKSFGHINVGQPWGMLANDKYGCCVWSGAAHETVMWCREAGRAASFTATGVLADYAATTGFDPSDPSTDQGTDMQKAASYRRRVGVVDAAGARHKIDAYVAVRAGDMDQVTKAAFLFGAVGVGLQLPDYAENQFDKGEPWSEQRGGSAIGGHYVPLVGRNSHGDLMVVTWGRLHAITPGAVMAWMDEGVVYLSLESLSSKNITPEGYDEVALQKFLRSLN